MKRIYLSLMLCCLSVAGFSQTAAQYSFSSATGTVTDISTDPGTTAISDISSDEAVTGSIPIGFSFMYCGVSYTSLSASSNGWLSLVASSTVTSSSNAVGDVSSIGNGVGLLMPMWDDLDGTIGTQFAYYEVTGISPFRVFTFQWGDAINEWGTFGSIGSGMFQVKLYESSNTIQFCYGNSSTSIPLSATIGITNNSTTDFQTLTGAGSGATSSGFTDDITDYPAANTIFTWLPEPVLTATPGTLNFSTGVSTNSASQMATIHGYGISSGNVSVVVNSDFEIFDGTSWVTSMTLPVSSMVTAGYIDTTVAVRFVAPATPGPSTGALDFNTTGSLVASVTLNGTALPVCTTTPTPGTVSATATTGSCSPYASDLSLVGSTTGFSGINYQWQTSTDDVSYTDVAGATNATYTATVGSDIFYRAIVGCSGNDANTTGLSFAYDAPPTAITGNAGICLGETNTFASTPAGGTWTSANTVIATIGSASGDAFGVLEGTTDITYEIANGCTVTRSITVNPMPAAIAGPMQVCMTGTVTLTNTDAPGTWSSSDDMVAAIGSGSGVVTGVAAGTATVTYMLNTGCLASTEFTVNALPTVYNVTGGGDYCATGAGVHIGLDNSDAGYTYNLYDGSTLSGTQTGGGSTVDFGLITAAGTYTVVGVSTESCMSDMSGDATVTITPQVFPTVALSAAPGDTVCAGTSTTFTVAATDGGTTPVYVWSVNGTPAASTSDTYTFVPADGDVIAVDMSSSADCPSPATVSDSKTMVVMSNETPTVSIVVGPNDTVCQYSTVFFSVATSSHGGTDPVFTWYKNGVTTGITGTTYAYVPANGNVISVKLNSSYRCPIVNNVASNNITMHVDSTFVPVVSIATNTGLEIAPGDSVTFTASVTNGGTTPTYQWLKNGTAISGANTPVYTTATLVNNDSIACVVWGTGDCSFYTFNAVKIKVTTGFVRAAANKLDVSLAPNPNSGDFRITGNVADGNNQDITVDVTNMLGQVVYTGTIIPAGGQIDQHIHLSQDLPGGIYILNLRSGTEKSVFRFVVSK